MTAVAAIRTAVIFLSRTCTQDPGGPFQVIAGLSLLQRQLRWLGQHDILTVHLVGPSCWQAAIAEQARKWRKDRRLPRLVQLAGDTLSAGFAPQTAVLLDACMLHHPSLLSHALSAQNPFVYVDEQGRDGGLGVSGLCAGAGAGVMSALPKVRLPEGCFALAVSGPADAREAERRLYRSFIKATDGWFSRHLNRPVSLGITRRIIGLPLDPNAISLITLLIGIGSGWSAAQGSPACLAAGGVLFQIASILDGVDGEVARAKLLHSKFGEWMDTVCDDLTNAIFILGVTWGMHRAAWHPFWFALGLASLAVYGLTLVIMYGNLIADRRKPSLLAFQEEIRHPGYRPGRIKAWLVALQPFIKRDFYGYAFMLCALLGAPQILLGGWSIGAFLTLGFIWSEWKMPFGDGALKKIVCRRK